MSERIDKVDVGKALGLIANTGPRPIAGCPRCPNTPLISTMRFAGAEFYCLDCGARVGFLSPVLLDPTPEMCGKLAEYQVEWDDHASGLYVEGRLPPTLAAKRAHDKALAWLAERAIAGAP